MLRNAPALPPSTLSPCLAAAPPLTTYCFPDGMCCVSSTRLQFQICFWNFQELSACSGSLVLALWWVPAMAQSVVGSSLAGLGRTSACGLGTAIWVVPPHQLALGPLLPGIGSPLKSFELGCGVLICLTFPLPHFLRSVRWHPSKKGPVSLGILFFE